MQTSKAFFAKIQGWGTKVTWQNYYDWWDLVALLWSQKTKRGFCIWEHLGSPAPKKAMVPKSKENFLLISTRWLLVYSCCNLWSDSECVIRFSGQYFTSNMPYLRIKLNITIIVHLYFNEHYIFHQDINCKSIIW